MKQDLSGQLRRKRYLCFGHSADDISGGLGDVHSEYDTFDDAMRWLGSVGYEHDSAYVFDRVEGITWNQVPEKKP